MMGKKEKLFGQFPPVTASEWMEKISADLKGADFDKKLVWRTGDGFDLMPFYRKEDIRNLPFMKSLPGEFPFVRGTRKRNNSWHIRQDIHVTSYAAANRNALSILMKGVDSLGFVIEDPETVNAGNFKTLLKDIHLKAVEINFLCNGKASEIFEIISELSLNRGLDRYEIKGAIEADPLGRLMVTGNLCTSVEGGMDYLASLTGSAMSLPNLRTLHIRACDFCNAGSSVTEELAFSLSMGNEYLSQLTERDIDAEVAAKKIRFSFGIGPDYFPEIAKMRAARMLWALILKAYMPDNGILPEMNIHSITGRWNKTAYDPYVNMLRTQTELMSAVIGGADSITVEPFDIVYREPDAFSERIARNQQLILMEEAHFDKVADPAAGSYYIETLTNLIAENAWKLYVETEEKGGFLSALKSGFIQKRISGSAEKKKNNAASGKLTLLGTNRYPREGEHISPNSDIGKLFRKNKTINGHMVEPLSLFRGAEEYEKLRLSIETSGLAPVVFLFTIGDPAMRRARARFSAGFFGCAGYNIIDNNGFASVEDGIKAAKASKADIIVGCSSDDEYASFIPVICKKLKNKALIVVAGNPPSADELKKHGVDSFIHIKSNVVEMLGYYNRKLDICNLPE